MTATEVLRRLLDERGVEYMKVDFIDGEHITSFDANGREHGYHEFPDGEILLRVWHLTPEQAIAATLGSCSCSNDCTNSERTETCHDKNGFDVTFGFECTVCGAMTDGYMLSPADTGHYKQFNFCPMCGRRIEQ